MPSVLEQGKQDGDSLMVAHDVLENTILQKAAEYLYDKYLRPKVRPYVALQTIELSKQ